jgi:hypothetical protein
MNPERFKYFTIQFKILKNLYKFFYNSSKVPKYILNQHITSKISKLIMFISSYLNLNSKTIIYALLSLKIVNILYEHL